MKTLTIMATLQPQSRIGDYELVRLLGCGGMGDVWMAWDKRADRPVALKFIKPHLLDDPGFRSRFLNEAKTLGRLEHDRVVTLYNVVEHDLHLALVLRFIDGKSLADKIDAEGALPLPFVLACARDVLPALGFAHEQGIIHRDIKPQNILIDQKGRSFLMDFGIAVGDFAERSTMTGVAVGTPHYMSPEQIQTPRALSIQSGGHRSDIYSFGIVLFEMLTGRVPFGGDTGPDEYYRVQHAHCVDAPPSLSEWNTSVPGALEQVVLRCLAKNPDERPQSCGELLELVESAISQGAAPPPRVQVARAATVFERAPSSSSAGPAAVHQAPPAPAPVSTARAARQGVPKSAWLAMAALVVAGSIGYGVWTSTGSPAEVPSKGPEITSPPPGKKPLDSGAGASGTGKTVVPVPNPNHQRAAVLAVEARKAQDQGRYCAAADLYRQASVLYPENAGYTASRSSSAEACGKQSNLPESAEAQRAYEDGKTAYENGDYCRAKALLDTAIQRAPGNADYRRLWESARKGCNANVG